MILVERAARIAAEAKLADARVVAAKARADLSSTEAIIAHLKLAIEKLRRELYGQRSERKARLLEQMELELEELEAAATEDELAAGKAAAKSTSVAAFQRRRPARSPFHRAHLDLHSRRPAFWRPRSTCGALLRLARSTSRASRMSPARLQRHPAGRCL